MILYDDRLGLGLVLLGWDLIKIQPPVPIGIVKPLHIGPIDAYRGLKDGCVLTCIHRRPRKARSPERLEHQPTHFVGGLPPKYTVLHIHNSCKSLAELGRHVGWRRSSSKDLYVKQPKKTSGSRTPAALQTQLTHHTRWRRIVFACGVPDGGQRVIKGSWFSRELLGSLERKVSRTFQFIYIYI